MATRESVLAEIQTISEAELEEVAEYLAHLKRRKQQETNTFDEAQLAALYAEFTEEDGALAEEDMAAYAEGLAKEGAA